MTAPMVFSIRAEYCARILDGSKRWEFRTRRPSIEPGELAYIYESRGRGRIVASFRLGAVLTGSPLDVWRLAHGYRGVSREAYMDYLGTRDAAFALGLASIKPLDMPLPAGMRAPQSWARLKVPS